MWLRKGARGKEEGYELNYILMSGTFRRGTASRASNDAPNTRHNLHFKLDVLLAESSIAIRLSEKQLQAFCPRAWFGDSSQEISHIFVHND